MGGLPRLGGPGITRDVAIEEPKPVSGMDEDAAALASEPPFQARPRGRRPPWSLIVKTVVTVGLIWLIVDKVEFSEVAARLRQVDAVWLGAAVLLILMQYVTAALRWSLILRALDDRLAPRKIAEIFLIGLFFNQALPSSIGGDALRVWRGYTAGLPLSRAVSSVLLDRALGFVALFVLAAIGLPWSFELLAGQPLRWLTPALAVAAFLALAILLCLDRLPERWRRFRLVRGLAGLARDGRRVLLHPVTLGAMLSVGLASALAAVMVFYALAAALGLEFSILSCLLLVPVVLTVTAVPISLAGWGLREGAAIFLFGLIGMEQHDALALSLCYGLLTVATSLPGGIVWLLTRERDRAAARAA